MAQYRVQMINHNPAEPIRDAVVNTFYLDTDVAELGVDNEESLAQDAANLFGTQLPSLGEMKAQIYNMADVEPRRPRAIKTKSGTPSTALGPREVAVCLSYYADQNIPRRRGRMYLGPWTTSMLTDRPGTGLMSVVNAIADGLAGLGGPNVQWVQYSPTTGEFHNVTNVWVDNEWDTIRSRGRKPTQRNARALEG